VAGKADDGAEQGRQKNQKSQTLAHEIPGGGIKGPRFLRRSLAAQWRGRHVRAHLCLTRYPASLDSREKEGGASRAGKRGQNATGTSI
jgi:hypothetical protein